MHVLRPKTVAESQAETTGLARRLFLSPRPQRMLFPILAFALMESYLLVYPAVDAGRVAIGAVAIALPAFIAAVATVPVAERLGGRMYFRRSFLLIFVSLILLGSFELMAVGVLTAYAIFGGVTYAFPIHRVPGLSHGAILWIREGLLSAPADFEDLRWLPPAPLQ